MSGTASTSRRQAPDIGTPCTSCLLHRHSTPSPAVATDVYTERPRALAHPALVALPLAASVHRSGCRALQLNIEQRSRLMVLAALVVVPAVVTIGVDLPSAMRDWPPRRSPLR